MENGIFSSAAKCGQSFTRDMDFDYISELLLGDECSDFLHQCSSDSSSNAFNPLAFDWPPSDTFHFDNIFCQPQPRNHKRCSSNLLEQSQTGNVTNVEETDGYIVPRAIAGTTKVSVKERLIRAISYMKNSLKNRDVLIQIWGPRDLNGKRVLTTIDQPYIVDSSSTSLANYRTISLNFQFPADKNSDMVEGMPGRVFLGKVPEWTPDVRFFRIHEYARVGYAQSFNVSGTLAVPVFDRGGGESTCLGVIEVVTTTPTIKAELDSVCEALQAVDLCSTGNQINEKVKACTQSYHAALPEILNVMKSACLSHNLPLAQTWMKCNQQGKQGCRHSNENYINCVSTLDSACYVFDPNVKGFHQACSEHHLLQGQGVVGKAFGTNDPCFCDNITSFCKTDYPLSHHARMFGLRAAVAIRFRSVDTGVTDFVLEFFLPADCREEEEHRNLLSSLSVLIRKSCKGLRVVTDDEFENDGVTSVNASEDDDEAPKRIIEEQSFRTTDQSLYETSSVIQSDFDGRLNDAAKSVGVCPTASKRICGRQEMNCWPSRKIQKVQSLSGTCQIGSIYTSFLELASPPSKSLSVHRDANAGSLPAVSVSQASSCSKSSSSSQSCSSKSPHRASSWNSTKSETTLKRIRDDAHLNRMVYNDPKPLPMSQSGHVPLSKAHSEKLPPFPMKKESDITRVKVTYGDDKIRIRMQKNWKFKDLQNEVARRFNINASGDEMQLKYLDDDSEWILLTCDADWEECIDVCMSYSSNTIKLSLCTPLHRHGSSSINESVP